MCCIGPRQGRRSICGIVGHQLQSNASGSSGQHCSTARCQPANASACCELGRLLQQQQHVGCGTQRHIRSVMLEPHSGVTLFKVPRHLRVNSRLYDMTRSRSCCTTTSMHLADKAIAIPAAAQSAPAGNTCAEQHRTTLQSVARNRTRCTTTQWLIRLINLGGTTSTAGTEEDKQGPLPLNLSKT